MSDIVYSVVVPVFNEEESLAELHRELVQVMDEIGEVYEIIYIDDRSTDGSGSVLDSLQKESSVVEVVHFAHHKGQSAAFYAGFQKARGRWIITLDADLQNDAADIAKIVRYRDEFDLIQGIRKKRKDSLLRHISSQIAFLSRKIVLRDNTIDTGCSLRCFHRRCLENNFFFFYNFHRFFAYLLQIRDCRILQIEVNHRPRRFGKSKYTLWRRLWEGLFDLGGVYWLKRRLIKLDVVRNERKN